MSAPEPMPAPTPKRSAKPLLIGCAAAFVLFLLLCGGGLAYLFKAGWERAAQDEEFARRWTAPAADAPTEAFAPESVAGYELASSDENAAFPALGIEQDGAHAVYEKAGDTVEVSVYRMNETEKTAAFDEVIRRIDDNDRFQSTSHVRLPRSLRFSVSPPDLNGVMWHANGWLVFVRSQTVAELDPFLEAYLEGVAGPPEDVPTE